MTHSIGKVFAGTVLLLGACLLPGCQTDVERRIDVAQTNGACRLNSDCAELLVCAFERCHEACNSSRDCQRGSRCVRTEQGRNVCQLSGEASCEGAQRCAGAQQCGVDGQCRDGCRSNDECVTDQVCSGGTCADPVELGPEGQLEPTAEPLQTPPPCAFDSDCPLPLRCSAGSCQPECVGDADCSAGERCDAQQCVTVPTSGACLRNSDCDAESACVQGLCSPLAPEPTPECDYDSDCGKAGQHCVDGACACECATDADCGPNRACESACQCVPSRVIIGDVVIQNDHDAELIADVTKITGKLSVNVYRYGLLRFPRLREAGGVSANGSTTVLVFDGLKTVSGNVVCAQDCRFPALSSAGGFEYHSDQKGELSLPALETTGKFSFTSSPNINALRLPRLATVATFLIDNAPSLALLEAPELALFDDLTVSQTKALRELSLPKADALPPKEGVPQTVSITWNDGLRTLLMPSLTRLSTKLELSNNGLRVVDLQKLSTVPIFELTYATAVTDLRLDSLREVENSIRFYFMGGPVAVSLPALTQTGSLSFLNCLEMQALSVPELTSVPSLELTNLRAIQAMSFPKLAEVSGTLQVIADGVKTLDAFDSTRGGALTKVGEAFIHANPSLPNCVVSAFQATLDASYLSSFYSANNCSCPGTFCQ